jgi:assimilatory nitrate reductase catalytic subunit
MENGGIQWPYPEGSPENPEQYRRLFADGRFHHPSGKAKFHFEDVKPLPEPVTSDFPFVLITGRGSVSAWHTTTRTGKVPILAKSIPADVYIEINEEDAQRLGIRDKDTVIVSSRRDTIEARAAVGTKTLPGEAFMAMHYPETNRLTYPSFDDYSRQPGYKFSAIRIKRK